MDAKERLTKAREFYSRHRGVINACAVIGVGTVLYVKGTRGDSVDVVGPALKTISPLSDEGVIIPWTVLESLVEKGGVYLMHVSDDMGDFLIQTVR